MNNQDILSQDFTKQNINSQEPGNPAVTAQEARGEDSGREAGSRKFTRDEIIAILKDCTKKLGHVPTRSELVKLTAIKEKNINRHFGSYQNALRVCGMEAHGCGYTVSTKKLFEEWALIVREMGQIPSMMEYELRSRYSIKPLKRRFGTWSYVPQGMAQYAQDNGVAEVWADVLDIVKRHCQGDEGTLAAPLARPFKPRIMPDRPLYGTPMVEAPMGFSPVNEMGVVFLFGVMAKQLGFMVTWMGTEFPDCEATREAAPGRWQRVRVEFEYESRNFLRHLHDPKECDLIVCWEHNWAESPLEVVELKKALSLQ
jgi:hypothetical protein